MTVCGDPLSRSLIGLKRTSRFAAQMSASDPKRHDTDLTENREGAMALSEFQNFGREVTQT